MPQLVWVPVAKPGSVAQPGEGAREVLRVERPPDLGGEDQPVLPPEATSDRLALGLTWVMLALGQNLRGQLWCSPHADSFSSPTRNTD